MNYKMIGKFTSLILMAEALFMIPALIIGLCLGEKSAISFLISIGIILAIAAPLWLIGRKTDRRFSARDGFICVGLGWAMMSLGGSLPFFISGEIPHFIDALFEAVSGFTTTGSSILPNPELLSKSILYWRSFTHWIGGMGVLVFLLAVVPIGGGNQGFTMHLLRAESPGPEVGKLMPKMRQTAAVLYSVYITLTVLDIVFLLFGKMPLFDAVCTAFGTVGTGGFGIKVDSIASYSPYIQTVTTVFMLLSGINFSCYYLLLLRNFRSVIKDEELHLYLGLIVTATVLIAINIRHLFPAGEAFRHAAFQVSSIISSTGYVTADFDLWPSLSKAILFALMIVGACAGSTGGGLKCARALLLFKGLRRNVSQMLRPNRIKTVRVNNRTVDEKILSNTNAYFATYILIIIISFVLVTVGNDFSMGTNFSAVVSCLNNIGPGFEAIGPTCNFAGYGIFSKCVLIFDMLAGRLEIFPLIILFSPKAWVNR